MYCKNCGVEVNGNQAVCLNCGVEVGKGDQYCANCGSATNPGAAVCLNCGFAIKNGKGDDPNYLNGKDKVSMAIICFFLGELGIHNFMLGETKKGVFKIISTFLLCGIGGIFALIDFIKILCGSYVVDPTKLI